MDIYQIMKWLEWIAYIAALLALWFMATEVLNWFLEWFDNWRERRAARKRNHAHPYNWDKLRGRLSDYYNNNDDWKE